MITNARDHLPLIPISLVQFDAMNQSVITSQCLKFGSSFAKTCFDSSFKRPRLFRNPLTSLKSSNLRWFHKTKCVLPLSPSLLLLPFQFRDSANACVSGALAPIETPDVSTLTLQHLIRNSASVTGEDVGSLLSLSLQQLLDTHSELIRDLDLLTTLVDGLIVAEKKGYESMCQDLWDGVTSQRAVISETRLKLLDTKVFFQTVLNLVSAAAETAFNADAEFVATGLNDKLNKTHLHTATVENGLMEAELRLAAVETQLMTVTREETSEKGDDSESSISENGSD